MLTRSLGGTACVGSLGLRCTGCDTTLLAEPSRRPSHLAVVEDRHPKLEELTTCLLRRVLAESAGDPGDSWGTGALREQAGEGFWPNQSPCYHPDHTAYPAHDLYGDSAIGLCCLMLLTGSMAKDSGSTIVLRMSPAGRAGAACRIAACSVSSFGFAPG